MGFENPTQKTWRPSAMWTVCRDELDRWVICDDCGDIAGTFENKDEAFRTVRCIAHETGGCSVHVIDAAIAISSR